MLCMKMKKITQISLLLCNEQSLDHIDFGVMKGWNLLRNIGLIGMEMCTKALE